MSVGKISGVFRPFIPSSGVSAMSRSKFSIRQRPKEEPQALPKINSEEAKTPSMDYSNFGSGGITVSLETPQEKSSPLAKTLQSSQETRDNNKLSDNRHKADISSVVTHSPPLDGNVFFNFLNRIIGKQQEGLSKIHKNMG